LNAPSKTANLRPTYSPIGPGTNEKEIVFYGDSKPHQNAAVPIHMQVAIRFLSPDSVKISKNDATKQPSVELWQSEHEVENLTLKIGRWKDTK
jgi:hypothetical protein